MVMPSFMRSRSRLLTARSDTLRLGSSGEQAAQTMTSFALLCSLSSHHRLSLSRLATDARIQRTALGQICTLL